MLLLPFGADHQITLRRAPDTRAACAQAWGVADSDGAACVASLRDLLGMTSAFEWRKKGVEVKALAPAPNNRVHPHYGVFSPLRGEYVDLVASTALPPTPAGQALLAFDIGTGSGVLAAVLARRGVARVVATDQDPRALACARENLAQLGVAAQVEVVQADLFPPGQANLVVCNPPWLPARASAPIDQHGLTVLGRLETQAQHPKAADATDPLHAARAAERTSLWRLGSRMDAGA
jgi:hypothetical protein